jgi:glycosyltransferase involved in cell wall biosynthesis
MKKVNLHIYPTTFKFESRIIKEVKSLLDMGLIANAIIVAKWENDLLVNEKYAENIEIIRVKSIVDKFQSKITFKVLYNLVFYFKVYLISRKIRIDYINCHSLLVLPIGVVLKFVSQAKLIYDPHELETEKIGMKRMSRIFLKFIECFFIRYADATIVVSDPIREWYVRQYGLKNIIVVRNMPMTVHLEERKSLLLKNKFKIPIDHILFIYQGLLVSGRGINLLLRVFSACHPNKHIVFMGYGAEERNILNHVSKFSNIHFQPAVDHDHIVEYTSSADVGVHILEEDKGLSYRHSLPNKFGEYLMSGIPIVVSNHYEYMSTLIYENALGWSIDSSFDNLLSFVNELKFVDLLKFKESVEFYKAGIGWEVDQKLYQNVYN